MSIIFDQGGRPGKNGRRGWLSDESADHITTEAVAVRLIQSAAAALEKAIHTVPPNFRPEVSAWCSAARGAPGSGVLQVTKGMHQMKGPTMHVTMSLKIPGSAQHNLFDHTLFGGQFHLDVQSDAHLSKGRHALRPIRLSYDRAKGYDTASQGPTATESPTRVFVDISGAQGVSDKLDPII